MQRYTTRRRSFRNPAPPPRFVVGVDLGQVNDYTAIAVVERRLRRQAEIDSDDEPAQGVIAPEFEYQVRFLERARLGTPYTEIAQRVAEIVTSSPLADRCELVVDATGVGRAVIDLLWRLGLKPIAVTVTSGSGLTGRRFRVHLPKQDVIARVQVLLQSQRLKIARDLPLARTLTEELSQYRMRVSPSGNLQFGAWREGEHDDLLFAVAIAVWQASRAEHRRPVPTVRVSLLGGRA